MYDQSFIAAYNNHKDSYDAVWSVVKHFRAQPIEFGNLLVADDEDKCAIHVPVFVDDTGAGCGAYPIGNHPSIKSLYDDSPRTVCHADDGARVIDVELARKVFSLDNEFVSVALQCGKRFSKRYMSGGYVEWTRYGRGYCYLQLLQPTVRHRAARILGPFPTVSDTMRFVIVFGNWSSQGFFLERLPGKCLHVKGRNWSPGTSLRNIVKFSATLGMTDRIGGSVSSAIAPAYGYVDLFRGAGYASGLPAIADISRFLAAVPKQRVDSMLRWMAAHGVVGSDDVLACLLVATSALAALNVAGMNEISTKVRMWQVLGDIVCKHFVAMHVLADGGSVEEYARLVGKGYQCNKAMSAAVVSSDLRDACLAHGLDLESKAWADILEGVIGVIAMTQTVVVLKRCLIHFNLIPGNFGVAAASPLPIGDFPQLNSGEWRQVAESMLRGKL